MLYRVLAGLALPAVLCLAQGGGKVVKLAPQLDAIVPAGAAIEKLAGGFAFTEGPVWTGRYLLFSDIPHNVIRKWTSGDGVSVFRENSGLSGPGAWWSSGSNGLTLDRQKRLIICEHGNRRVTRLAPGAPVEVLADRYEGKRLNSPNDVVCRSDGSIYFTDPPYGLAKRDDDPAKELSFNGIYRLAGGQLRLLYGGLTRPNGLAFSPGERYLYVANSDEARKLWMRFEVAPDGGLANGKVFFDVTAEKADGLPDGLKVDARGNVYCTGPGGIWIFSPEGRHLGTIQPAEVPANCAWGDDGRTLYMTARTGLYRIRLKVPGIRP